MQELDQCTGTLVICDDIAVECTDDDCREWSSERHDLTIMVEHVFSVGERLAG